MTGKRLKAPTSPIKSLFSKLKSLRPSVREKDSRQSCQNTRRDSSSTDSSAMGLKGGPKDFKLDEKGARRGGRRILQGLKRLF